MADTNSAANWTQLVRRIREGDSAAFGQLYVALRGLRYYFVKEVGPQGADDLYQEFILDLYTQVRDGQLRDPARLVGYASVMAKRKVLVYIANTSFARKRVKDVAEENGLRDPRLSQESALIRQEQQEIAFRILNALAERDREVLIRFYLKEQSPEQIQHELGMTETQFRLVKSRAKKRFTELLRARFHSEARRTAA